MYHSYQEIFAQGETLTKTLDYILGEEKEIRRFFRENPYDEVVMVACGSSYWASMSACLTFQQQLGVPCSMVKSGDVVLNQELYRKKYRNPLFIAPSRSGSTSETVKALEILTKAYGAKVFSLVEYPDSALEKMADLTLFLPWANEISVCQTRSFSNLYLAMVLTAAILGEDEGLIADLKHYLEDFDTLSEGAKGLIKRMIEEFPKWQSLVCLGHGPQYGVVVEGAYINVEMAQIPAHYFATLEWRHGPIVLSDDSYLVVFTAGGKEARELEEGMARETRQTGAKVLAVYGEGDFWEKDYGADLGWDARPETVALYSVMILQGIAYEQARKRGVNPDAPGNLPPWIAI